MTLFTLFSQRPTMALIVAGVTASMAGVVACAQHSQHVSLPASGDLAWSELRKAMQAMHEAMLPLKSTDNNDVDFVRLMLPHHQAALDMATAELTHGKDPQMRRLAQEIVTDQQSEIDLMRLWLTHHNDPKTRPANSDRKEQ